jgi:hypothetical protein
VLFIAGGVFLFLLACILIPHFVGHFVKWDGAIALAPIDRERKVVMQPPGEASVLIVCIDGNMSGDAEIWLGGFPNPLRLPRDLNRVFVFDWYGGECTSEYIPGKNVDGAISMRWRFRPLVIAW